MSSICKVEHPNPSGRCFASTHSDNGDTWVQGAFREGSVHSGGWRVRCSREIGGDHIRALC